uniref:GDP-mannose 4,6-dehydratase n=1 Tax=Megaviridae environmental sample TaxID=1737588 RepID=A0A5J6VJ20_9VIRU|nr:MAG: GDP-mannose 4,6 dehydratase [Megaviridae environmental sample]
MGDNIALITGITGQDGSYLAELLLEKGYYVWGIVRRSSLINTHRIDHIFSHQRLVLKHGDVSDGVNLFNILSSINNQYNIAKLEIYNLAAMSHVKVSFEMPEYTGDIDGLGVLRLLEAIRSCNLEAKTRFYQASTSELYGQVQEVPQNEKTPFYPRSPYGVAKLYGFWIVKNYREAYNMYACNGILFNHESPRRGETFVTRKITIGLGKILRGEIDRLVMGNIDAMRDWGHARDYVKGMWLMLQQNHPDDYVLATGVYYTVREFIEKAFSLRGFNIKWKGSKLDEIGYDESSGRELIFISEKYFRRAEVNELLGDASKAKINLDWESETSFDDLVKEMVDMDCPQALYD